jgi:hypothetical protein
LAIHDEDWAHYKYTGDLFKTWFNVCGKTDLYPGQNMLKRGNSQMSAPVSINIDTRGGPYIAGDVNTHGGGFIGRDEIAKNFGDLAPRPLEGDSRRVIA